jgi:hypothetical protein
VGRGGAAHLGVLVVWSHTRADQTKGGGQPVQKCHPHVIPVLLEQLQARQAGRAGCARARRRIALHAGSLPPHLLRRVAARRTAANYADLKRLRCKGGEAGRAASDRSQERHSDAHQTVHARVTRLCAPCCLGGKYCVGKQPVSPVDRPLHRVTKLSAKDPARSVPACIKGWEP